MNIELNYIKKINWRQFNADLISGLLLIVFLYTACNKLSEYGQFRYTLSQSVLLNSLSGIIAWLLPATELTIAVLLFIPAFRSIGLWVSAILITGFTCYLAYMIINTPELPCTCGGVLAELSWRQHIAFNLFLITLCGTGIILYKKNRNRHNKSPP